MASMSCEVANDVREVLPRAGSTGGVAVLLSVEVSVGPAPAVDSVEAAGVGPDVAAGVVSISELLPAFVAGNVPVLAVCAVVSPDFPGSIAAFTFGAGSGASLRDGSRDALPVTGVCAGGADRVPPLVAVALRVRVPARSFRMPVPAWARWREPLAWAEARVGCDRRVDADECVDAEVRPEARVRASFANGTCAIEPADRDVRSRCVPAARVAFAVLRAGVRRYCSGSLCCIQPGAGLLPPVRASATCASTRGCEVRDCVGLRHSVSSGDSGYRAGEVGAAVVVVAVPVGDTACCGSRTPARGEQAMQNVHSRSDAMRHARRSCGVAAVGTVAMLLLFDASPRIVVSGLFPISA